MHKTRKFTSPNVSHSPQLCDRPIKAAGLINFVGVSQISFLAAFALAVQAAEVSPPPPAAAVQSAPAPTSESRQNRPQKDEFPPSPLELIQPDPLLPNGINAPLTASDRQRLTTALDDLNRQAAAKLTTDPIAAFNIWNRELRLRRALGFLAEVQALGRVGDQAWKQNQPNQVQIITKRLQAIQAQVQTPTSGAVSPQPSFNRSQVLQALGIAYQQVRSPSLTLSVYQPLLAEARQRREVAQEIALLNTIAQVHLDWFDYTQAAAAYTELLNASRARGDRTNEAATLTQLAYVHEQAKQPAQAAPYQQQLAKIYQNQQPQLVPALKVKAADNYAASGQFNLAEQNYQEAFTLAQPLFQLAYATEALHKLGALYRANDRLDAALRVYAYLAGVEQQADNVYGVMDAYDQIGQIHLTRKAYAEALSAFNQGLTLAKQINHRTDYFASQIQQTQQKQ